MRTYLTLILLLFSFFIKAQSIERVEPPFWWTGMQNETVQLMIYGSGFDGVEVSTDYTGVGVENTFVPENSNYLFVDLAITDGATPGAMTIEVKGKKKRKIDFELKQRTPGSAERQGFTNADVMYLITPDRFVNGDPSNDNHPEMREKVDRSFHGGRHGGDIEGIRQHLGYLKDIGYTAIWVNPVLENNMESYSYHGYSTTDFYRVDPRFGSNDDYVNLSTEAGQQDIKMIMDMIVNHCGSEHWWMKDLPFPDWINSMESYVQTNHQKPTIQDPYRSDEDFNTMVNGWFVPTMPDLNQKNPYMATYLIQNAIWWIEYANLAGIRMDTYPYSDMEFMTQWTCAVMKEYPNFNITGEEWSSNPIILAHWQKGKTNANGYTSCLPSLIDFPIRQELQNSLNQRNFFPLYEMLANDHIYADPTENVVFADNHDMDRFYTQVGENLELFKLGMMYVATTRGTPQIYYGTEILFTNDAPDHGVIRQDFPGGWDGDEVNAFTGEGLSGEQLEARAFMTQLLNWRKEATVIHDGKLKHFVPYDGIYVFFRYNEDKKVMVVLNANEHAADLSLDRFDEMLNGHTSAMDVMTGSETTLSAQLAIEASAGYILELR